MPTHPIDAPASPSLIAAFLLILALGVTALVIQVEPRNASSTGAVPAGAVAEFGD